MHASIKKVTFYPVVYYYKTKPGGDFMTTGDKAGDGDKAVASKKTTVFCNGGCVGNKIT